MARWPYRVVFWPSDSPSARPGTIPRASLDAAHAEARAIAADGGTAQVRYMSANGEFQVLQTYRPRPEVSAGPPDPLPRLMPPTRTLSVAAGLLGAAALAWLLWRARRSGGHRDLT